MTEFKLTFAGAIGQLLDGGNSVTRDIAMVCEGIQTRTRATLIASSKVGGMNVCTPSVEMYWAAALKVVAAGRGATVEMNDVRTPMTAVNCFMVNVVVRRVGYVFGACVKKGRWNEMKEGKCRVCAEGTMADYEEGKMSRRDDSLM